MAAPMTPPVIPAAFIPPSTVKLLLPFADAVAIEFDETPNTDEHGVRSDDKPDGWRVPMVLFAAPAADAEHTPRTDELEAAETEESDDAIGEEVSEDGVASNFGCTVFAAYFASRPTRKRVRGSGDGAKEGREKAPWPAAYTRQEATTGEQGR
jgi:hypothetical protein